MTATAGRLVSVVIAAFNAETYLGEAITSVFNQDWEHLDVVVVDDGSTDGTVAIAGSFGDRLRVIHGSHEGLAATRNRGTAAAHGDFLLHLDADDLLLPTAIRTLMAIFEIDTACDIAAGRFSCFISPELSTDVASRFNPPTEPQRGHLADVAMVRSGVFDRVGHLDESYEPASDIEWWLRACQSDIGVHFIDDQVALRRLHRRNTSLRESDSLRQATLRIARDSLRRRRSGTRP